MLMATTYPPGKCLHPEDELRECLGWPGAGDGDQAPRGANKIR